MEIDAAVCGLVATTTVRQTFRNTRTAGIEATYIFPLPDRGPLGTLVDELADDLASVNAPADLRDALRRLAEALREPGDPRAELAAAREAFARIARATAPRPLEDQAIPPPFRPRPAKPVAEPDSRRRWWR